jgi:tetratricopeptide (TPR) repeat protein/transglutaminase-like putative cysteine protease
VTFTERFVTVQRTLLVLSLVLAGLPKVGRAAEPAVSDDYFVHRLRELEHELAGNIDSPRAAATLYRLAALEDDSPSLAPIDALLAKTATNPHALGEVRQLARYLQTDIQSSQGKVADAQREIASLAFATSGWLIGGFDNEGGTGHAAVFGPEKGHVDLRTAFAGKEHEVAWRQVPALGPEGRIPVGDLLRPRKNMTFYFLTTLNVPSATQAVLHYGTSGPTKLWVNGVFTAEDTDDHPARYDQHAVSVPVRAGANVVLVKVSTRDEAPGLYLRASGLDGLALAHAAFTAPSADAPVKTPLPASTSGDAVAAKGKPVAYEDVTAQLAKLVAAHPNDGALREDYAMVLAERRPFDSKTQLHRREQEAAAKLLPKNPMTLTRLAKYIDDDHNLQRQALEAALAADPKFSPARALLASYYLERGFVRRGYDEAERAAADQPGYYHAQLALAAALSAMGLDARATRLQISLADRFPSTPQVLLSAARAEKGLGHFQRAMELFRKVIALRYDEKDARNELGVMLVDSGDASGAVALLRETRTLVPTSIGVGLRLADLLSYNSTPGDALTVYDYLHQMVPDEDAVFESRGQHLLRQGDATAAIRDFKQALLLKPQNPKLQELVRSVATQENYAGPYLRDAVALAREAHAQPTTNDDDSLVLADLNVVRVYPNGLSSRYRQQIVEVLNDRGVEKARVQGVQYSPGEQEIKVERARVIKKDGSVVEAKSEADQELTDSWAGMYFDHRQHTVAFPSLEIGDVVEFTYRLDDVSQQNMFADYFGDVHFFQGTEPRRDIEYVLIAPPGRTFYSNAPGIPNLKHTVEKGDDGRQILRWQASNVVKVDPEPKMPGWANVAAYLHVSTFKEWDDVARFWWGMVKEQLAETPEIQKAAEEAVAGIPASDVRGRVRAVYDYVVTKTRYVGLEFGIHGFKPYKVDRILARRFGDCKDKASLMYAMLSHLGIKSNLVLLRMRSLGQLAVRPASLAVFNHCILFVPGLNLYLDGTAEFSGSGELPGGDQGAQVLVVQNDGTTPSMLVETPVTVPVDNVTTNTVSITLAQDGSAKIQGQAQVRGQAAQSYRRNYESETGRREKFEQSYARSYPGAHATTFEIGDPRAIEKPVETRFTLAVPRLARTDGSGLVFSPFGEPWRFAEANAPLSKRTYPVELGAPWRNDFVFNVQVPAGYIVSEAPIALEKESPFGSYQYSMTPSPQGVTVSGHVSFSVDQVSPAQYGAFRSFLEEMDRTFSRRLHLAQATASNAPEAN